MNFRVKLAIVQIQVFLTGGEYSRVSTSGKNKGARIIFGMF